MPFVICWKCKRSVEPVERREKDKKSKKMWLISSCPFERCAANLDLREVGPVRLWNSDKGYFEDE